MLSSIRSMAAWIRNRWHADLTFRMLASHADDLARFDRLDQLVSERHAPSADLLKQISLELKDLGSLQSDILIRLTELEAENARGAIASEPLTSADYRRFDEQGVFVVGCARSGTTVLCECLNHADDVLMLGEAFFFGCASHAQAIGRQNYDFAEVFNHRHELYNNLRYKGTYIPPAATPERTPFEFLKRMTPHYRLMGEKIAFGPRPHPMGEKWEAAFRDFQATYFYQSTYFITLRKPAESVWSMDKLFPGRPVAYFFECWLRSLRASLDVYLAFPNTNVLFFENFGLETVEQIARMLNTEINLPEGAVGQHHQRSRLANGELPEVVAPHRAWWRECQAIYDDLKENFCPASFQYNGPGLPRRYFRRVHETITALLARIPLTDEQMRDAA